VLHIRLYSAAIKHRCQLAGTHCTYSQRDGQAKLIWVASPSLLLNSIRVMVIVWRLRGNIIRTALCWICDSVHSQQHTYINTFILAHLYYPGQLSLAILRGWAQWVPANGRWCSATGSKGRYGVVCR